MVNLKNRILKFNKLEIRRISELGFSVGEVIGKRKNCKINSDFSMAEFGIVEFCKIKETGKALKITRILPEKVKWQIAGWAKLFGIQYKKIN